MAGEGVPKPVADHSLALDTTSAAPGARAGSPDSGHHSIIKQDEPADVEAPGPPSSSLSPAPTGIMHSSVGENYDEPPQIVAGNDTIVAANQEELFEDEGYGTTSETGSYMSSILSSVRRGVQENGRTYAAFGKYEYGIPIDEMELDRNDLQHHKFFLLLGDKLYLAPIPDAVFEQPGSRILDLGTGTGVWAIEMADKFPNTEVVGSDIAATQPSFVPPNCIFEIEDCEDVWPYVPEYFDFIHAREFLFAIRDWPKLIGQAYNALRPGGWIQLAATIPDVNCDDDSMPVGCHIKEAGDIFLELGDGMGAPCTAPRKWKQQLLDAGYTNVEEVVLKIPTSPWPKDKRLRTVGAIERAMLADGLESMMLRGWTQLQGRRQEDLAIMVALTRNELRNLNIHVYCFFHVVYAQRPGVQQW